MRHCRIADTVGPCPNCSSCMPAMPRLSWPSSWRTVATSPPSSPNAAMTSSASSRTTRRPGGRAGGRHRRLLRARRRGWLHPGPVQPELRRGRHRGTRLPRRAARRRPWRRDRRRAGLCQLAAARHGLRTLRAATTRENLASQKVLANTGFVPVTPPTSAVSNAPGISAT